MVREAKFQRRGLSDKLFSIQLVRLRDTPNGNGVLSISRDLIMCEQRLETNGFREDGRPIRFGQQTGGGLLTHPRFGEECLESLTWLDRFIRLTFVGPLPYCVNS